MATPEEAPLDTFDEELRLPDGKILTAELAADTGQIMIDRNLAARREGAR